VDQDVKGPGASRAELERSQREFAAAQQLALVGSWDWDLDTNVVHWSVQLYDLLGLDRGTVASLKAYLDLVTPDDRELVTKIRDALARHDEFRHEVPSEGARERSSWSRQAGSCAMPQDVTEARREGRAYSAVIESAFDCIVTMDSHGRVTEFNLAAQRVFGYSRSRLWGRRWWT